MAQPTIGRPPINLAGQRFGKLTVRGLAQTRPLKRRWYCVCDCGNACNADQGKLREGTVKSCGCLVSENARIQCTNLTLPPGESFINSVFRQYTRVARKLNREFSLSKEFFRSTIAKPCHYCGAPPKVPKWIADLRDQKLRWFNGAVAVNGLDRTNNKRGYTPENVVPCCKTCNYAKRDLTVKQFLAWARQVIARAKHQQTQKSKQ